MIYIQYFLLSLAMFFFRGTGAVVDVCSENLPTEFSHANNPYLGIQLNPNPTNGTLNVKIYGLYSVRGLAFNVQVLGIKGDEIADLTAIFSQNSNGSWSEFSTRVLFPVNGIYFLIFRAGKYTVNEKFIVVK